MHTELTANRAVTQTWTRLVYFLREAHHSLLVLGNTTRRSSTVLGAISKGRNHQQEAPSGKSVALSRP